MSLVLVQDEPPSLSHFLSPQIHEGMVVYVCFFHGATEDIVYEMGKTLQASRQPNHLHTQRARH